MSGGAVLVVQARMGSTRLPGKVLAEVAGRPMLRFQLDRLRRGAGDRIVVATSDRPADDPVATVATEAGVDVIRGPEHDVLRRFNLVLNTFFPDEIVRLTGDCPLTDPAVVTEVLDLHRAAGADYTCNVLPRSFPRGLDVEVVSAGALLAADAEATDPSEREHVLPFVYRRPERFRLANLLSGDDLGREPWTVDTAEDLRRVRAIVDALDDPDPVRWGWREILEVVGEVDRPGAHDVVLRVGGGSEPGDHPWRRQWTAERDDEVIGTAELAVGAGQVVRDVTGDQADRPAIDLALDRLLHGDQQVALVSG